MQQYNVTQAKWDLVQSCCEQPIAYASRALTETETTYSQIEKETFGQPTSSTDISSHVRLFYIESDHQHFKVDSAKLIQQSPKRLQRILMALQTYTLEIQARKEH